MLRRYVFQKLLYEDHPKIIREQCLNEYHNTINCTTCQDVCPAGALTPGTADPAKCVGCNICVAACPAQCIRPSSKFMNRVMALCAKDTAHVTIRCDKQKGPADFHVPCLSALSWEVLGLLALKGTLTLAPADCAQCSPHPSRTLWKTSLMKLHAFLGDLTYGERVNIAAVASPAAPPSYSRREALSLLFTKLKNTTLTVFFPSEQSLAPDGSLYRQLLVYQLKSSLKSSDPEAAVSCSWIFPVFSETCTACGVCTKTCPRQALHRVAAPEQAADTQTWYMAVLPWLCTHCRLCQTVCPAEGIKDFTYQKLADPTHPQAKSITAPSCPRCREPMPTPMSGETDNGLCPRCQAESGGRILWRL